MKDGFVKSIVIVQEAEPSDVLSSMTSEWAYQSSEAVICHKCVSIFSSNISRKKSRPSATTRQRLRPEPLVEFSLDRRLCSRYVPKAFNCLARGGERDRASRRIGQAYI